MSTPTADQVADNINAGIDDDRTPNTNVFAGAWAAFQDFTGNWATNLVADISAYTDLVGNYTGTGHQ